MGSENMKDKKKKQSNACIEELKKIALDKNMDRWFVVNISVSGKQNIGGYVSFKIMRPNGAFHYQVNQSVQPQPAKNNTWKDGYATVLFLLPKCYFLDQFRAENLSTCSYNKVFPYPKLDCD